MVLTEVLFICVVAVALPKVILAKPTSTEVSDEKEVHLHHHYHHHHHHHKKSEDDDKTEQVVTERVIPVVEVVNTKEPKTIVYLVNKKNLQQEPKKGFLNTPRPPIKPIRFISTTTAPNTVKPTRVITYVTPIPSSAENNNYKHYFYHHYVKHHKVENDEEKQDHEQHETEDYANHDEEEYATPHHHHDEENVAYEEINQQHEHVSSEEVDIPKAEVYYRLLVDKNHHHGNSNEEDDEETVVPEGKSNVAYTVNYKIYPDNKAHKNVQHVSKHTSSNNQHASTNHKNKSYSESYFKIWA